MNRNVEQPVENDSAILGSYVSAVLRHRWLVILCAFVLWAAGLGASLLVPKKFRSDTVILIEPQNVLPQYVTPNVAIDLQQRMQSLTQQILSRTRLVKIMDAFHLYGQQPNQEAADALVQRMRDDINIELIKGNGRGDDISAFKVSYSAQSPEIAQSVLGQITSLFIDENLHDQEQLSEDTTAFLDTQLAEARKDLEHQEQLLGAFRSRYIGELPEQLSSNVQILSGLQSRLQSATTGLHQAEQQKLYLASLISQSRGLQQHESASPEDDTAPVASNTDLDDQIDKMKADLADLSARYTSEHPDVVRLKDQIANAEAARRRLDAAGKKGTSPISARSHSGKDSTISPMAQLESQLKATDLEIINRRQEVRTLESEIEQYQARLNLTPIREQELADVERNHQQSRANYDSLLAKKLQSGMATDLAKRQQSQQFSVLDPPSRPQRPYWPNRLQFSLMGLLGGLVIGVVGIVLKEVSEPRIRREEDVRQWFTKAKVVASIPLLLTDAEQRGRSRRRVAEVFAGSLMVTCIALGTAIAYWH